MLNRTRRLFLLSQRIDLRLTPPAEIPPRPMDLRAKQGRLSSVTDDVVSAAKSVFHAVVPEQSN